VGKQKKIKPPEGEGNSENFHGLPSQQKERSIHPVKKSMAHDLNPGGCFYAREKNAIASQKKVTCATNKILKVSPWGRNLYTRQK